MKESVFQNGENEAVLRPQRIQLRIGLETAMNIGVASIYENFFFLVIEMGSRSLSLPPIPLHRNVQQLHLLLTGYSNIVNGLILL